MALFFINVIRGDSADRGDSSSEQRGRAWRRAPGAPPCSSSLIYTWATNRSTTASILHPREDQYGPQAVWRRSSLVNRSNRLGVLLHGCMHDASASVASELACAYIYTHLHGRKPTTPSIMESTKTPDSKLAKSHAYTRIRLHKSIHASHLIGQKRSRRLVYLSKKLNKDACTYGSSDHNDHVPSGSAELRPRRPRPKRLRRAPTTTTTS